MTSFTRGEGETGEIYSPNQSYELQQRNVFQKGYELNNRVIRPARVLVVKN